MYVTEGGVVDKVITSRGSASESDMREISKASRQQKQGAIYDPVTPALFLLLVVYLVNLKACS